MRKNRYLIFVLIFLLFIPVVYPDTDYNETGNYDNYYQLGTGFFNDVEMQTSADYSTYTRSINSRNNAPLVTDLDNDGINEIIILDGNVFRLYNNRELDILDAYTLRADERHSNFIAFNIDGDNYTEIIISLEETEVLEILEWNGTDFNLTSINYSALSHDIGVYSGETMIKCRDVDDCFMAYTNVQVDTSVVNAMYGAFFNSSFIGHETQFTDGSTSNVELFCFPTPRNIVVADFDNDDDDEYIFTWIDILLSSGGSGDDIYIYWVEVMSNHSVILEEQETETRTGELYDPSAATSTCFDIEEKTWGDATSAGIHFTAPLVFDIDSSTSNGLETVIGFNKDDDEFLMTSYSGCSSDGCEVDFLDDYPEVYEADGNIISNVMRAAVFPDGNGNDFCVLGYNNEDDELDLLCASEQTTWSWLFIDYETVEFKYAVTSPYNLSREYDDYTTLAHMGQHSTDTYENENLHEVINSYGVLSVDWDTTYSVQVPPIKSLDRIFENPKQDAVVIAVDAEKVGRDDLIALTSTNLWYIDDKYTNSDGYISYYYVNPCLDATWKVNTSLEVRIKVNNEDSSEDGIDDVSAKAILYYGTDNEQDSGWSNNVTAGTTISFASLLVNQTISTGTIRLMGRDATNFANEDILDLTFSVGIHGVEFGDCTTEMDLVAEEEAEAEAEIRETDLEANAITGAINEISDMLGGLGTQLLWYIFMFLIAYGIWQSNVTESHPSVAFGTMIIAETLMLIVGTMLGIVPVYVIVTLSVITSVFIGLWVKNIVTGSRTNGT